VCLGATAAKAALGPALRVSRQRGRLLGTALAPQVLATVPPAALLRSRDAAQRQRAYDLLVADLGVARQALAEAGGPSRH